jgi:hypothetical protein
MSAHRKDRLLREALGAREGGMPAAEGLLVTAAIVAALLVFVLFAG